MTAKALRKLLKKLPPNMKVLVGTEADDGMHYKAIELGVYPVHNIVYITGLEMSEYLDRMVDGD